MNFQTAVTTCLTRKYAAFSGRASRPEYWWFVLAYVIGGVVISLLGIRILGLIYMLALIVPATAAGFRRLQDTGRPGWYFLIPTAVGVLGMILTPAAPVMENGQMTDIPDLGNVGMMALFGIVQLVLAVVFIWWLTRPSQPETNAYGPPPAA